MTRSIFDLSFIGILICLFCLYCYQIDKTTEYGIQTDDYARILTRSCDACVQGAALSSDMKGNYLFHTEDSREVAKEYFFNTLSSNFNLGLIQSEKERLQYYVPVLCMIDMDGYYICYNQMYYDNGDKLVTNVITPINTWAELDSASSYMVRFTLTDYVEITNCASGEIERGSYTEVYRKLGSPLSLNYMSAEDTFQEYKTSAIIRIITEQVEYYINAQNHSVNNSSNNDLNIHYTFYLPEVDGEDWCNLLEHPTCLAFLQGIPVVDTNQYLNIYSMAGSEFSKDRNYRITRNAMTGELTYHRLNCSLANGSDIKKYSTREECARKGAFPCEICNP